MGIIRKGILGGFSKKTGPLVGAIYKNQNIIRSLPLKSSKSPTQPQLDQRLKFGIISSLLSPISELITTGFASKKEGQGPMQRAIACILGQAIKGESPDFSLAFTKICFSKGRLALPDHAAVEALSCCKVEFSWIDQNAEDDCRAPGDLCTLLVYDSVKSEFSYQINAGIRFDKFHVLQLPDHFAGDTVYCYLSFNAVMKRGLVSPSIFLGTAIVI